MSDRWMGLRQMVKQLKFESINEHELFKLNDENLVEYIVNARDAGQNDLMAEAIGIFAFRRENWIMAKIDNKNVPFKDQDQVFMDVIASTLAVAFKGGSVGEMVNLIKRVMQFRIADYFEKNKHDLDRRPRTDPDGNIYDDIEDIDDDLPGTELRMLIQSLIDQEQPRTQRTISLRIQGYPSKEAAAKVTEEFPDDDEMTFMNVDQIFSRFRKQLKRLLEGGS